MARSWQRSVFALLLTAGSLLAAGGILGSPASADTMLGNCDVVPNPTPTVHAECSGDNLGTPVDTYDFDYADLDHTTVGDSTDIDETTFVDANLTDAVWADPSSGAPYYVFPHYFTSLRADYTGATLDGVDLRHSDLRGSNFTNAHITNASFINADLGEVGGVVPAFTNADLAGTDFTGAGFDNSSVPSDFTNATLTGANFTNTDLVPSSPAVTPATGPDGASVTWVAPQSETGEQPGPCSDAGGPVSPGSVFPVGTTTVTCEVTDTANDTFGTGTFTVTVTGTVPAITTSPSDVTVAAGATASFSAAASGDPAPTVQWQVSTVGGSTFTNVAGATSTTYSFTATADMTGNEYQAVFTNPAGTATTTAAVLTVETPPAITTSPSDVTVAAGATASFSAAASGDPAPSVQWQVSTDGGSTFTNVAGATSTTYSFTTTAGMSGNEYQAVFTNPAGTATTMAANLTVDTAPAITSDPSDATVLAGSTASFSAAASGDPAPSVQWQVSTDGGSTFTNVAGATSTTYSFTATADMTGNEYQAVFTNPAGTATTTAAVLTVETPPAITTSPSDATVVAGATASFGAAASGNPAPSVQWQVSTDGGSTFTNVAGATSTTYSFTTTAGMSGNEYQAVFTNPAGTATSTAANLTVDTGPAIISAASTTFTTGTAGAFTVTTTGNPAPALSESGALPGGITFNDNGDGTATLAGTAAAGSGGRYPILISAANGIDPNAIQAFTLTVDQPPAITSADHAIFTEGAAAQFTVTTTGFPDPTITEAGALPPGVTLTDTGNGTATLSGTATTAGAFGLTLTATNAAGTVTQTFTLTVLAPLTITGILPNGTVGVPYRAGLTATGGTPPYTWSLASGTLPPGLTLHSNGAVTGTPTTTGSFTFTVRVADPVTKTMTIEISAPAPVSTTTTPTTAAGSSAASTDTSATTSARSNTLAFTGTSAGLFIMFGLALLVVGGLVAAGTHRRRRSS